MGYGRKGGQLHTNVVQTVAFLVYLQKVSDWHQRRKIKIVYIRLSQSSSKAIIPRAMNSCLVTVLARVLISHTTFTNTNWKQEMVKLGKEKA